jgi:precorrin-6B methylase 2
MQSPVDKDCAPFEQDIEDLGAYRYTGDAGLSAQMANERYTRMILSCAEFAERTVVDVGAGDGTYTAELARLSRARSIVAVEPSAKAVARAEAAYRDTCPNLEFMCGTSAHLLEGGRRFDIAVYRGVLHHVSEPRTELKNALKLADTVILLEPNGLNPAMKVVERLSSYHRKHREQSFRPGSLRRWIAEVEGDCARVCFFGLVPYFCPDRLARFGRLLEPLVERIPGLRTVCCGQYVLVARRKPASL